MILKNGDNSVNDKDIINCIRLGCEFWELSDNFTELNSSQWDVVLKFVGRLIKDNNLLNNLDNNINCVYNRDNLYILLDYYIELCNIYNKRISINGYCSITGLNNISCLNSDGLTAQFSDIIKRADADRVASQATDSNVPVLRIAYNNFVHNWNGQIKQNEIVTAVRTLEDIRRERLGTSAEGAQNARFSLSSNCTNEQNP